jgi:GT2 family glycosyltransferase
MGRFGDLVSVVIPTFNRRYCLSRAIDSALRQTHTNVEVLVVDDGSSDGTAESIRREYPGESRLRYLWQENRGVSAARNHGLREAQGAYIAFLDSDDIWKPWKVELQLASLRRFPEAGMVWTDMEAIGPDGAVKYARYLRTMYSAWRCFSMEDLFSASCSLGEVAPGLSSEIQAERLYCGDLSSSMIMGNMVHTSTVLLTRERCEKVGEFDEGFRIGEDYPFHLRTCREGPVGFMDVSSIQYSIGLEDRLTRPELGVCMARNFLRTIEPIIQNERESIRLPDHMLRLVLAEAYSWLGEKELDEGDNRAAARDLLRSLRNEPRQARTGALAVVALLPHDMGVSVRDLFKRLRGLVA